MYPKVCLKCDKFSYFYPVKKTVIRIFFLFLTVSVVFAIADYSLYDAPSSYSQVTSHKGCSDLSDHSELTHNHGSEDNVLMSDSRFKSIMLPGKADFRPYESMHPANSFISCIWQPPKFL